MTATETLYQKLKHDIVTCALSPGKSFSECELGERYQTSRTPVREACRNLASERFITIIPFRGYFVSPLTIGEFNSLQEVQLIVDPSATELAAEHASPNQVANMEKWAAYKYEKAREESYYEFLDQNRSLHVGIAEATGNDHLAEIVSNVHTRLMRYFYLGLNADSFGEEIVTEHRAIVEAIGMRRGAEARRLSRQHIMNTMRRSTGLLSNTRSSRLIEFGPSPGFTAVMKSRRMDAAGDPRPKALKK
jgi:GntR family transcriptional regulator, rspAB operon transcriptional repressor